MKVKSNEEIKNFLLPYADGLGVEIVDVEFKISKNPSLTIFIETALGVDLTTLEKFHNLINDPLDELDPSFGASYTLNVSSPGVDRAFKYDRDFERNLNKKVEVKLFSPIKSEKYFEGELIAFDKSTVTLKTKDCEQKIERSKIAKINQAIIFK